MAEEKYSNGWFGASRNPDYGNKNVSSDDSKKYQVTKEPQKPGEKPQYVCSTDTFVDAKNAANHEKAHAKRNN